MDLLFKNADFIFSYRVGGILIHNGKILVQRPKNDEYSVCLKKKEGMVYVANKRRSKVSASGWHIL